MPVSFGKDSLATLLPAKEHGEPLDEAVYCEVMFDKGISGEVPEYRDFIYETTIPRLEEMGARMLALQAIPGKTTEKFNRTQKFSDIDAMFRQEDGEAALRQAA